MTTLNKYLKHEPLQSLQHKIPGKVFVVDIQFYFKGEADTRKLPEIYIFC